MTTLTASSVLKEGNTAVITGASSGIGRAAAWDFVSKGMNVWMVDNDKEELEAALELARQKNNSNSQVRNNIAERTQTRSVCEPSCLLQLD
jgi:NADP-dependent 3-hydroxy acid dehydrogenase YdfG